MLKKREIRPTAWSKAFYYYKKKEFDYIWFIEDDVFISSLSALGDLDNKYKEEDLLVGHAEVYNGDKESWYWWQWVPESLAEPWGVSLNCASRFSYRLFQSITDYCLEHKEEKGVLFNEYLFHTLALHNNYRVRAAEEMQIVYRKDWTREEFQKGFLYHPIKDFSDHEIYRIELKFA